MTASPSSAAGAILDFAAANHTLSAEIRADVERLLADTLASGAAGARSPEAQALLPAVSGWGRGGDARLLTGGDNLPAASAAYFNGFAIHCLEWDAVHEGAVVHALSTVTASLLAVWDRRGGGDIDEFLTAIAVGVDIAAGIGLAASGAMKFFRPATAGIIGSALAAARLAGLERGQYDDVLGLAYSQAAGTMQAHVEASIALPLQIAGAARGAVMSVDLAQVGMNGPHHALEGPFGYGQLIEDIDLQRYTADLGRCWRIGEVSIKPFPSGRASHGALGALWFIRDSEQITLADVESVTLRAPPLIQRLVGRPFQADMTPAYARLCLPLLVPMMLRDGHIDPSLFTAQGLSDPDLKRLGERTVVELDDNPDENALAPQQLTLKLANGRMLQRQIDSNLGSPETPMNAAQSRQKYDLCRRLAGSATPQQIFDNPTDFVSNT